MKMYDKIKRKSKQLVSCLIAVFIIIATICTLASCSEADRVNHNISNPSILQANADIHDAKLTEKFW